MIENLNFNKIKKNKNKTNEKNNEKKKISTG